MSTVVYIDMDDVMCDFTGSYHSFRRTHPQHCFSPKHSRIFREPATDLGCYRGGQPVADIRAIRCLCNYRSINA